MAVAGSGLLEVSGTRAFRPYFASFNPSLATAGLAALGAAALIYLRSEGWSIARATPPTVRRLLFGTALAAGFAIPVIAIDFLGAFPRNLDVQAPESILFYPVIALVAECVFHAIPLALLGLFLRPLGRRALLPATPWPSILAAALIEPTLQAVWSSSGSPGWATAYVAAHVFAINLTLLYVFRRFDFLTAYGFRTLYYLIWHVAWGAVRVPLLFGS